MRGQCRQGKFFSSTRKYPERNRNSPPADYAWALIPNHFHLLLRTGTVSISTIMRRLLTGYALWYNRRHRRNGHLFQNRYKSGGHLLAGTGALHSSEPTSSRTRKGHETTGTTSALR
ncbi:transposase [Desulfobacula sp.]|uniref:transposase n=1 Tax=Desulfobacula sp. TaxID=2593537 RepID=UPI00345B8EFA